MRYCVLALVVAWLMLANSVFAQYGAPRSHQSATRGAVLGGVAGAALGGVIGHQNDKAGKGALIGGAVGAIAGAAIGNERDKQVQRQYAYNQGYYSYGQTVPTRTVYSSQPTHYHSHIVRPVSVNEVVNMTRSGVSDHVIVAHIQSNGVLARPTTNDIVFMSQQGVSDSVISAMQGVYSRTFESPVTNGYGYQSYPSPPQYYYPSTPTYPTIERKGF